jgi:hypothetical protein
MRPMRLVTGVGVYRRNGSGALSVVAWWVPGESGFGVVMIVCD